MTEIAFVRASVELERSGASSGAARRRRLVVAVGVLTTALIVLAALTPRAARSAIGSTIKPVIAASAETFPVRFPRSRLAPASLRLGFTSATPNAATTPELTEISFELARDLELRTTGLPSCPLTELYSTASDATQACAGSLVGYGAVTSEITLPGHAPVTVEGRLSAFFDYGEGQPRILAQVVGSSVLPLTYVIPFTIRKDTSAFSTVLSAAHMQFIAGICAIGHPSCFSQTYTYQGIYGHISRFELTLARRFTDRRKDLSLVNADCPAPGRSSSAVLPLVSVKLWYPGVFPSPSELVSRKCEVSPQRHRPRKR